jgi:hypothetical protein
VPLFIAHIVRHNSPLPRSIENETMDAETETDMEMRCKHTQLAFLVQIRAFRGQVSVFVSSPSASLVSLVSSVLEMILKRVRVLRDSP